MADEFGTAPVDSAVAPCPLQKKPMHWLEIELIGEDDKPIPFEEYLVVLPDGTKVKGFLDKQGYSRLDNIPDAGVCKTSFPRLDQDAWEKAG